MLCAPRSHSGHSRSEILSRSAFDNTKISTTLAFWTSEQQNLQWGCSWGCKDDHHARFLDIRGTKSLIVIHFAMQKLASRSHSGRPKCEIFDRGVSCGHQGGLGTLEVRETKSLTGVRLTIINEHRARILEIRCIKSVIGVYLGMRK